MNSFINVNVLIWTLIYIWNLGSWLPLGRKGRDRLRIEVKKNFSSVLYYVHTFEGEDIQMCACVYTYREIMI